MADAQFIVVNVPREMWERLEQHAEDTDYCPLCDNHPSHGHAPLCPLGVRPAGQA